MEFKFPMLLDGATGTRLQEAGMPDGACSETWVLENPDVFLRIQQGYVEAGSMVLLTPTFGGNRVKLMQHGISDIEGYNRRLVELTVKAAQGKALVAGDIAPTGRMIYPYGDSSVEGVKRNFQRASCCSGRIRC